MRSLFSRILSLLSKIRPRNSLVTSMTSSSEAAQTTSPVIITEGKAKIRFANETEVFYNPVQEFNRDLR